MCCDTVRTDGIDLALFVDFSLLIQCFPSLLRQITAEIGFINKIFDLFMKSAL
jgi:hypothetical protein